jgi:hypothetical protein
MRREEHGNDSVRISCKSINEERFLNYFTSFIYAMQNEFWLSNMLMLYADVRQLDRRETDCRQADSIS